MSQKYDKETLAQLRIIDIEKPIDVLEKRTLNQFKELSQWTNNKSLEISKLQNKVKVLEDSRERQTAWSKKYSKPLPKQSFFDKWFK